MCVMRIITKEIWGKYFWSMAIFQLQVEFLVHAVKCLVQKHAENSLKSQLDLLTRNHQGKRNVED